MQTTLYTLDFDGVICDSAVETGMTGWKVAIQLWSDMPTDMPIEILDLFRIVRPVMETGYEAVLIVRLLFENVSPQTLLTNFTPSISHIIRRDQLTIEQLKTLFGQTRDQWIEHNLAEWIEMNPLFDGIVEKIQQIKKDKCYIITTKQERFVKQIFAANGISVPADQIFGLDRNLTKPAILAKLQSRFPSDLIKFVEDRLPTLSNVINDESLANIDLYFADWGYNTKIDKAEAMQSSRVKTITLDNFLTL